VTERARGGYFGRSGRCGRSWRSALPLRATSTASLCSGFGGGGAPSPLADVLLESLQRLRERRDAIVVRAFG
jgi:hypothetical protein